MPSHDPLTASQRDLLRQIEDQPLEIRIADVSADLRYLMELGYISPERVHIAQDPGNRVWRYGRSDVPFSEG